MSTSTLKPGYCAQVVDCEWDGRRNYCERKGPHKEQGKEWCRQHAPSLVKARQEARLSQANAAWKATLDNTMARASRQKAGQEALDLLVDMMVPGNWNNAKTVTRAKAILDSLKT